MWSATMGRGLPQGGVVWMLNSLELELFFQPPYEVTDELFFILTASTAGPHQTWRLLRGIMDIFQRRARGWGVPSRAEPSCKYRHRQNKTEDTALDQYPGPVQLMCFVEYLPPGGGVRRIQAITVTFVKNLHFSVKVTFSLRCWFHSELACYPELSIRSWCWRSWCPVSGACWDVT